MSAAAATQGIQRSGSGFPQPPFPASECDTKHRPCVVGLLFPPQLTWVKWTTQTVLKLKYFNTKKHKDVWEWRRGRPMEALTSMTGPAKGRSMSLWSTDQNRPRQKNPDRSSSRKHREVKNRIWEQCGRKYCYGSQEILGLLTDQGVLCPKALYN